MSNDSFFREVDQEFRQEQAKALWDRYGLIIIAIVVAIIVATGSYVALQHWNETRANRSGDAFSQALTLIADGDTEGAMAALQELEEEGYGAYPVLARMRAATLMVQSGDAEGAIASFDAVAADRSVPAALRDMARLRAAYLLVDHGDYAAVAERVETLAVETNVMRHSAREVLGLAGWKEGRATDALAFFQQITDDPTAPASMRQRAELMSELIRGSGTVAES